MNTWKRKGGSSQPQKSASATNRRPTWLTVLFLLSTLLLAGVDAPWIANQGLEKIGVPQRLPDAKYRLGLDLQGGTHLVYEADLSQIPAADHASALEGARDVIENRVNAFGVSEPLVQTTSSGDKDRLIVELAGVLNVEEAIRQIGETPILEFKEPGQEQTRDLTDEEKKTLESAQAADRKAAADLLLRARNGENFDTLVAETSLEADKETTKGVIDGIGQAGAYKPLGDAIAAQKPLKGAVLPEVVETVEGLNIVKYLESVDTQEQQLSHLLICFEGSTGCSNPIPEIEASIKIEELAKKATPANFAALVKENSTDKSSEDGALGWVLPGDTVPAFEQAATALKVGTISAPVKTDFGYHLIYKQAQRTAKTHKIQRSVLKLAQARDIVGDVSPWKNTGLSGKQLKRASVAFDQNTRVPHVQLQFDGEGADLFAKLTESHVGQPIAIFLDGKAISTPTVQQAIYGGEAVITGNFTLQEAKDLAQRLNTGALPVPVKLVSQQTIGPTLGAAWLDKSIQAAWIGFLLVAIFMIAMYRLPGIAAIVALLLYTVLNIGAYRLFGVTLTLSGIAGLVLSLGIAVDANVLIFERFKEEFRAGRDLRSAMDEGFSRAWPAIRDGHLTTLISTCVLYFFASSFIKGFALTLTIGVILSLFTAVGVTRSYMRVLFLIRFLRSPALYGVKSKN